MADRETPKKKKEQIDHRYNPDNMAHNPVIKNGEEVKETPPSTGD